MNKITIYRQPCNGNQWHWLLDRGGLPRTSSEAFATADEAEAVARIVGRCENAEYFEAIPQIRRTEEAQFAAEYEAALAVGRRYEATGDAGVFFHATYR